MSTDLTGKVAVVTGASLGIGRATAIAFGKAGASVVVNYRSHPDQAQDVVALIEEAGGKAVKEQVSKAEAEEIKGKLEAAGAEVELK